MSVFQQDLGVDRAIISGQMTLFAPVLLVISIH